MWAEHILLAGIGFCSGLALAGGTFALIITLRIIPRIVAKEHLAVDISHFENVLILGGVIGNIFVVFPSLPIPGGHFLLVLYGLCSGIQVGCLVMALAEIMSVFPILFRRLKLKKGLSFVIICMAAGKVAGALLYFCKGYAP